MFKSINFYWLLKFIYRITKYSGFLLPKIVFNSNEKIELKQSIADIIIFVINIGLSLYVYTFGAYIPMADLINSKLLEVGMNIINRFAIFMALPTKVISTFLNQRFLEIITDLKTSNAQVSSKINRLIDFLLNDFFYSYRYPKTKC